jgi:branched-chain amino acid transport system permease protein
LISSLGLYLIISQFISITWGDQARYLRHSIYGLIAFGPVSISRSQLAETVTCISLLAGVGALLSSSGTGLKLRALAANENQFAIEGNDVRRLRLIAFALSGLVATVVSLVTAYDVGFDPSVGLGVILLAVVATVIGGRGSFAGPVVAGMALGILRAAVTWTLSAQWQDAVTFVIFTTLLLLAPDGLITLIHPDRGAA